MGNWTIVEMEGSCDSEEVSVLQREVAFDMNADEWENFNCLSATNGICGLGNWAGRTIDAVGNLAERDYGAEDVAEVLEDLVKVAPSLNLKVHVGGEYEDKKCVATVTCYRGVVTIGSPEIKSIGEISEEQMRENLIKQIRGQM